MSEDVKDFLEILQEYSNGGMSGLYPSEKTVKEFIEYVEQLQQENKELFIENMKLKDKLEQQKKEYQETYKDVREEIKELKQEHNVLTEFEKWLEDTYNHVGSTDILEVIRKYDFVFGLEGADIMLKTINFVKCKLQELKEGKK